jgi:hypothetical protein
VVIGADCIGSCKSNYHSITVTTLLGVNTADLFLSIIEDDMNWTLTIKLDKRVKTNKTSVLCGNRIYGCQCIFASSCHKKTQHFTMDFLLMWCNFKFEGVLFRSYSRHNDRVDSLPGLPPSGSK